MGVIKKIVDGNTAKFEYFRDGELWYSVQYGPKREVLLFPVPTDPEEIGNATFLNEDKAILFMRYIRKYLEKIEKKRLT